jgi:NAD(P)H-dependent flavin oxidoreductase YrpB (nitropropane dioxygenase family)
MALSTPITQLFGIKHPILLAGMAGAAGPELAAAVTNAGGLGSIGGVGFTPDALRKTIKILKDDLEDKNAPFGVDLLLPQVGGGARKTNKDYTGGNLPELIDIIIEEKAALFICAVGVPPKFAVDKLHAAGIPVMNMIGAVKHATKALEAGCDIICAQGGEGGGHTGDTPTSILLPGVVDVCRGHKSPLTGGPVLVVGAGGIFDGRGLAMALSAGCSGVWVGTRFIASEEAGAGPMHKQRVVKAGYSDTMTSTIYTGRPMRIFKTPYTQEFEKDRANEIVEMSNFGIPAFIKDLKNAEMDGSSVGVGIFHAAEVRTRKEIADGLELSTREERERGVYLTGACCGAIKDIKPARAIVEDMVAEACVQLQASASFVVSKL